VLATLAALAADALLFGADAASAPSAAPAAADAPVKLPAALLRPALKVARPEQANLMAVARAGNRLVAAGERGLIIYSDDSGQHWSQAQVPVSVTLTALRFANEREGWAVGNMGAGGGGRHGGPSAPRGGDGRTAAPAGSASLTASRPPRWPNKPRNQHGMPSSRIPTTPTIP
jgi:hypothetical protein